MALDFHRLDNDEYLFSIDETQLKAMSIVFERLMQRTGITVSLYDDAILSVAHQKLLLCLIDEYAHKTDLNQNTFNTVQVLSFRGLLVHFGALDTAWQAYGD